MYGDFEFDYTSIINKIIWFYSASRLQLTGELLRRVAGANYSQLRQLEGISSTYIEVEPRKKNARPNDVILSLYGPAENIQVLLLNIIKIAIYKMESYTRVVQKVTGIYV